MGTSSGWKRLATVGIAAGVGVSGFVVAGVVTFVAGLAVSAFDVDLSLTEQLVLGFVLLQGIAFPLVSYAYLRIRGLSLDFVPVGVPSLRGWLWVVGGYVASLGLAFALLIVVTATGTEAAQNQTAQTALENPDALLWLIPVSLLLIGPGEELLFRGIIQGTLRRRFGPATAIVLASAMFAPAHILALAGSLTAMLVTISILFVPSLVFGVVYERTQNLVVPALVHGFYDATLFGLAYVSLKLSESGSAPALL